MTGWKLGSDLTKTVTFADVSANAVFTRGKLEKFESLGLPYAYSFSVQYDTGECSTLRCSSQPLSRPGADPGSGRDDPIHGMTRSRIKLEVFQPIAHKHASLFLCTVDNMPKTGHWICPAVGLFHLKGLVVHLSRSLSLQ